MNHKVDVVLNDIFDMESSEVKEIIEEGEILESNPEDRNIDIEHDYIESRNNYYKLFEQGVDAMEYALDLAKQSDNPRAFEVVGQLLKNTSEVNDRLMDLQKKMEELKALDRKGNPTKVTNALFVGSTSDLQKLIKEKKKDAVD
tara:strand:+ start:1608 stop:2039 length:432 start_codon:yes stop_codon:yes gene_type:complete